MPAGESAGLAGPYLDPELATHLNPEGTDFPASRDELVAVLRTPQPTAAEVMAGRAVTHEERRIVATDASHETVLSLFAPRDRPASGVGVVFLHGGGMVSGNRFVDVEVLLDLVEGLGAVGISVEYRLAPEHPFPAGLDDCVAALAWMAANASGLGVDPARVVLVGVSAGGGLAAATAQVTRDRGGPPLAGQLLSYPMLDDRDLTASGRQMDGIGIWDRASNRLAWSALLGTRTEAADVSPYAAPARVRDAGGLPPAYIEVGSAEMFRDEAVEYASLIWNAGGDAELHVWPGGFHAFDLLTPHARLSREPRARRVAWVRRVVGRTRGLA